MCPVTAEIRNYGRLNEMINFSKYMAGVKFSLMVKTEYPQFPQNTRPLQSHPQICVLWTGRGPMWALQEGLCLDLAENQSEVLSLHVLALLVHLSQKSVCHCCLHVRGD